MQICMSLNTKLFSEESFLLLIALTTFFRSLSHSTLARSFLPFIELLEMNYSLNGRRVSQLTCDGGFISRDWKSFFLTCCNFEKDFLRNVWWWCLALLTRIKRVRRVVNKPSY